MRALCVHRARYATACPSSVRERRACTWHTGWAAWFPHCGCSGPRIFHPVSNRWSCPWKSFVRAWSQSVRVVHRLSSWRPVLHAPAAQSKVSSGLADPLPLARAMPLLRRFPLGKRVRGQESRGVRRGNSAVVVRPGVVAIPARPRQSSARTQASRKRGGRRPAHVQFPYRNRHVGAAGDARRQVCMNN